MKGSPEIGAVVFGGMPEGACRRGKRTGSGLALSMRHPGATAARRVRMVARG